METSTKLIDSPGTIPSEVWGARTERVVNYVVIPDSPPPYVAPLDSLHFFVAGAEMTGGPFNPNSFYSRVDVSAGTNDAHVWGAEGPGGAASYIAARPAFIADTGTILIGHKEWGGDNAIITRSTDYGKTWTETANADGLGYFQGITASIDGTKLWAGANGYVYQSIDDGVTWAALSEIASVEHSSGSAATCFVELPNGDIVAGCQDQSYFAGGPPVLMRSTDAGLTWAEEHVFPSSFSDFYFFGVNRLYYNTDSYTLWALTSSEDENCLYWNTDGSWVPWVITPEVSSFAFTASTVTDVIFDELGRPAYISGLFNIPLFGTAFPAIWEAVSFSDLPAGGVYKCHLLIDTFPPARMNFPYQLMDLRTDITIDSPGVYICGSGDLLKINDIAYDAGSYGPPFSPGDVAYLPTIVAEWTPWGEPLTLEVVATGMVKIPSF